MRGAPQGVKQRNAIDAPARSGKDEGAKRADSGCFRRGCKSAVDYPRYREEERNHRADPAKEDPSLLPGNPRGGRGALGVQYGEQEYRGHDGDHHQQSRHNTCNQ